MMLQPLNHIWINQVSFKIPSPIRPYPPETLPSVLPPFPSPAVGCLEVATPRRSRSPSRAARLWLWPWPWRRPGRPRPARPRRLRGRYEGSEEYLKIIYIYVIIYYNMYIYLHTATYMTHIRHQFCRDSTGDLSGHVGHRSPHPYQSPSVVVEPVDHLDW